MRSDTGGGTGRLRRVLVTATAVVLAATSLTYGDATARGRPGPPPRTESGTFTALSYNVAGLPAALSSAEPEINTPLISPLLDAYDLVLVQESWIDPDPPVPGLELYHDVLVGEVTHAYQTTPVPPPMGTDPARPSALVSDGLHVLSRFPLAPETRVMWEGCFGGADTSDRGAGDCLSQKGFVVTRTTVADGVEVDVYNLHGEAGATEEDQRLQGVHYRQLADFVAGHSAGRAILLGGDTNLHTGARHPDASGTADREIWRRFLAATGMQDVCDVVACGADEHVIDKFAFRSGGGVTLEPLSHRFEDDVFVRDDGAPLSDHRALAVTVRFTSTARDGTEPPPRSKLSVVRRLCEGADRPGSPGQILCRVIARLAGWGAGATGPAPAAVTPR